jgi:hypothetical protein
VLFEPILIYNQVQQSPTFPVLTADVILQLISKSLSDGETVTLRFFRGWVKERLENRLG